MELTIPRVKAGQKFSSQGFDFTIGRVCAQRYNTWVAMMLEAVESATNWSSLESEVGVKLYQPICVHYELDARAQTTEIPAIEVAQALGFKTPTEK